MSKHMSENDDKKDGQRSRMEIPTRGFKLCVLFFIREGVRKEKATRMFFNIYTYIYIYIYIYI